SLPEGRGIDQKDDHCDDAAEDDQRAVFTLQKGKRALTDKLADTVQAILAVIGGGKTFDPLIKIRRHPKSKSGNYDCDNRPEHKSESLTIMRILIVCILHPGKSRVKGVEKHAWIQIRLCIICIQCKSSPATFRAWFMAHRIF